MKKLYVFFLLLLFVFSGCEDNAIILSSGIYQSENDQLGTEPFRASLVIDSEKNRFTFNFDSLSSYFSEGPYSIKEGVLTATTEDGRFVYLFKLIDSETLAFIETGSTKIRVLDERFGEAVNDGMRFVKTE